MILTDTHTHLYAEEFHQDIDTLMEQCIGLGITQLYMPNVDSRSIEPMLDLEHKYPNHCFPMIGLHPCYVKENYQTELQTVKQWLEKRSFCAIGEIGMDLYWDQTFVKEQERVFRQQVEWSLQYDIPFIIHCREAFEPIYQLLIDIQQAHQISAFKGIFHCFSGTAEQARRAIDLGFYLGIGGVVTYKNAGLDKVVEQIPLAHLVLETDAPYLAPVPHRGKRNQSNYLIHIAEKVASLHQVSLEEVARMTSENAKNIFVNNLS